MDWLLPYAPLLDVINVVATVTLALVAFLYSRKATRMNFIIQSTSLLNSVNSEFLANEDNLNAMADIRDTPSKDVRRDYLMLNNLNYLHAIWSLGQEHAISRHIANAKLENGAGFWLTTDTTYLDAMLKRGFPDDFRTDMLNRITRQRKAIVPETG